MLFVSLVLRQAPDSEQHRQRRGQENQHRVDPPEVHSWIQKPLPWVRVGRAISATKKTTVSPSTA